MKPGSGSVRGAFFLVLAFAACGHDAVNSRSEMPGGSSLTDALARRDVLGTRQAIYRDLAQAAVVTQDRYSRSEVKFRSTVSVSEMQSRADDLPKEYGELDATIQETNWKVDLVE